VTTAELADFRNPLYEAYASQHVRHGGGEAAALVYRRDIRPLLPPPGSGLQEHLTKPEVLATFDDVAAALAPGGVFVARVPNAVSPLGGHIRAGDFTHQTSFTARSVRQLAAAAGLTDVIARVTPAVAHGLASAARVVVRQVVSACYRLALAAETGVLRGHIVTQNLTFAACKGALVRKPAES
jgi:hypothetical protein